MPNDPPGASARIVKLKYMDTEPGHAAADASSLMQGWEYPSTEPLLDGPVSRRLAVIDLDPETGALRPGARFVSPNGKRGYYEIANERDSEAADFQQVSVFTTVLKMMSIFEAPDVLGRKLRWAFEGEQLLIVPRAGKMANAFYHRDSRSLQFFFIDDPTNPGKLIHTCLSPDIVAHEATHAILDGISPDLYNATSPQSLAMHEAVADLGAVMLAVRTAKLRRQVMRKTNGDLRMRGAFSQIAPQLGEARSGPGQSLRDLNNEVTMTRPGQFDLNEPHDLSNVLTGALYAMLVDAYEAIRKDELDREVVRRKSQGEAELTKAEADLFLFPKSGRALFLATEKFKRVAFRALDYLPPGEIAFADYGRAMVAADLYSNPDDPEPRDFIKREFVRRGMVADPSRLDPVAPGLVLPADLDLDLLLRSDWAAYQFAEARRAALLIPAAVPFEVRPRLDVTRRTWRKEGQEATTRAFLFKVAWQDSQSFDYGGLVQDIAVMHGTTLAIDWQTREVCTLLSTSPDHLSQKDESTERNEAMRRDFVAKNLDDGEIELGSPNVQIQDGRLRLRAMGQMLHMMGH